MSQFTPWPGQPGAPTGQGLPGLRPVPPGANPPPQPVGPPYGGPGPGQGPPMVQGGALIQQVQQVSSLTVVQKWEMAEFFGFETRNKYDVQTPQGQVIGHAAESQKGALAFLARQFLGHWRTFEIHLFDTQRQPVAVASHPFRWILHRLDVHTASGQYVGSLQQQWRWFHKNFDVLDAQGRTLMHMEAPLWKLWTFPLFRGSTQVAQISKKWAGILTEMVSDKDKFQVEFRDSRLSVNERMLLVLAAVFIDLMYFEHKANR